MGVLRLLLAVAVFCFHTDFLKEFGISILDGRTAVFCFFVVSGFYMEMVLVEKYNFNRLGPDFVRKFWLARFWRLYPTYFVVIIATLILAFAMSNVHVPKVLDINLSTNWFEISKSIVIWFFNISMFFLNLPSTSDLLIGPGWSLGIEISFYAIAPFCLKLKTPTLMALAAVSIALQFIPYGQHAPVLFGFHVFLLGALARRYSTQIMLAVSRIVDPTLLVLYGIVFLLIFFAAPGDIYVGVKNEFSHNTLNRFIYPVIIALLIPFLHERTKNNKSDFWIGQLSYPFYLLHTLVIATFANWPSIFKTSSLLFGVCLSFSVFLMLLEVRFIEPVRARFSKSGFKADVQRTVVQ